MVLKTLEVNIFQKKQKINQTTHPKFDTITKMPFVYWVTFELEDILERMLDCYLFQMHGEDNKSTIAHL